MKPQLRDLIVAILTAIVTYLLSSCAGGLVIGTRNRQIQEVNASADSAHFIPTLTITR